MSDKKYKLVKTDKTTLSGQIVYRIKALKDFNDVKKGDLGGYIQTEDNLSHKNNAWVYNGSVVFDDALISGDARIMGESYVYSDVILNFGDWTDIHFTLQNQVENDIQNKKHLLIKVIKEL
jgi:hypothetical protein